MLVVILSVFQVEQERSLEPALCFCFVCLLFVSCLFVFVVCLFVCLVVLFVCFSAFLFEQISRPEGQHTAWITYPDFTRA